jgi:hypothetical protein
VNEESIDKMDEMNESGKKNEGKGRKSMSVNRSVDGNKNQGI